MAKRRRRKAELPEKPELLVIERGQIGELLVVTPALRALRKAYPEARITVMARPRSAPVLIDNPAVDRLLPISEKEAAGFAGVMRLSAWIRAKRFDAAFILHTSFRSALIVAWGAVPVRAGLTTEGRGFLLTHKAPRDPDAYRADEHLKVVSAVGIADDGRETEMHLTDEEIAEARELLGGLGDRRPLVALHPGASHENRQWPTERFAELGARLADGFGATPFYLVGPKEEALAEAVAAWWKERGRPEPPTFAPKNVRILAALLAESDGAVTNNTGPMHIAAAVDTPCVAIHGPTPPARWQPAGTGSVGVYVEDLECRPCDKHTCEREDNACLTTLPVDVVLEKITGLLRMEPVASAEVGRRADG